MSAIEILLLILGAAILTAGYVLPVKKKESSPVSAKETEKMIREMVDKEVEAAREKIDGIVDETITYSVEKAERSMERLSNEKIMAINEYSDTVLQTIHKNHDEVVFLYDMLNDKHENLKSTVSEAGKTVAEVKQTLQDAQVTAKEVSQAAEEKKIEEEKKAEEAKEEKETFAPFFAQPVENMESVLKTPVYIETSATAEEETEEKAPAKKKEAAPKKKKTVRANSEAEFVSPDIQLNKGPVFGGNNNDRILEMHKAGKSNMAIAKELGLGIGEVKLVIDLYKGMSD